MIQAWRAEDGAPASGALNVGHDPEPARQTACENCGTAYDACTDRIMRGSAC